MFCSTSTDPPPNKPRSHHSEDPHDQLTAPHRPIIALVSVAYGASSLGLSVQQAPEMLMQLQNLRRPKPMMPRDVRQKGRHALRSTSPSSSPGTMSMAEMTGYRRRRVGHGVALLRSRSPSPGRGGGRRRQYRAVFRGRLTRGAIPVCEGVATVQLVVVVVDDVLRFEGEGVAVGHSYPAVSSHWLVLLSLNDCLTVPGRDE